MKKIVNILVLIAIVSCKAQSPVISLFDNYGQESPSCYRKDTHNDFNKFEGTWLYQNGATTLKIIFKKRIMQHDLRFNNYTDMLVGEYEYIENGIPKANTLANLSNTNLGLYDNTFSGDFIITKNTPPACLECQIDERRVELAYNEQDRKYLDQHIVIRHYTDALGEEYIKLKSFGHVAYVDTSIHTGPILEPTLPNGTYILIKL